MAAIALPSTLLPTDEVAPATVADAPAAEVTMTDRDWDALSFRVVTADVVDRVDAILEDLAGLRSSLESDAHDGQLARLTEQLRSAVAGLG